MTASAKRMQCRSAAHTSWANTSEPAARTASGRKAFLDRFERQVDPFNELPELERIRRAGHARKAYFVSLAAKSAAARRRRRHD